MITVRRSKDRGHFEHGWLETFHTFSFADYHDPAFMGFRNLRVINEDFVQPGEGFPTHGHRDMEILTWILGGALEHKDSMGTGSVIRPGELQFMSAGKGVLHSEFNASKTELVHLLQIWIEPSRRGGAPRYQQKDFTAALAAGTLVPLATPDGADGSLAIGADARLAAARLPRGRSVEIGLGAGRSAWVQVARGGIDLSGHALDAGDGAALTGERTAEIEARSDAELLWFDLP